MNSSLLFIAFLVVGLTGTAGAQDAGRPDVNTEVHQMMANSGIPGLQTVVVKNGRVVWERSYGYAVLEP